MKCDYFVLGFRDVVLIHLNSGYIFTSYLLCILILTTQAFKVN